MLLWGGTIAYLIESGIVKSELPKGRSPAGFREWCQLQYMLHLLKLGALEPWLVRMAWHGMQHRPDTYRSHSKTELCS